jgi:hypothetical protein
MRLLRRFAPRNDRQLYHGHFNPITNIITLTVIASEAKQSQTPLHGILLNSYTGSPYKSNSVDFVISIL